jgi:hypothetical protein
MPEQEWFDYLAWRAQILVEVMEDLYQPGRFVSILPSDGPEAREGD